MNKETRLDSVLFDSSALISWIKDEKGADKIGEFLYKVEEDLIRGYISVVSVTELFYILASRNIKSAYELLSYIEESNLLIIPLTYEIAKKAGNLKLKYGGLSTADSQIIASLINERANAAITGDKEWKKIDKINVIIV